MRIALGIEYNGSHYCGWQRQAHSPSVQERLECVLSGIADHSVSVICAGRTDTGVHAVGQVVHFELKQARPERAWLLGGNTRLPDDISILWARRVSDKFHARFSATARSYRYIILNRNTPRATLANKVTWVY
ncbi:MAG TPA: tRNA pseudouridine synthase A, partial [Gammaproteobacteria bacterium]|nr:tRNA pseudouridine synthase A [Gammaproteobacteria bacterium]